MWARNFEGIRRADVRASDGGIRDTADHSIVRAEWPAVRKGLEARRELTVVVTAWRATHAGLMIGVVPRMSECATAWIRRRSAVVAFFVAATLFVVSPAAHAQSQLEPQVTSTDEQGRLATVVPTAADLRDGYEVLRYAGGDEVRGRVSLNLCAGPFPSERFRTGRKQVGVVPTTDHSLSVEMLSVEVVSYPDALLARQAMREIRGAVKSCPKSFVEPLIANDIATKWRFQQPPDRKWSKVPGVDRAAFDFVQTTRDGRSGVGQVVYQQRGRFLVGLYGSPERIALALPAGNEEKFVNALAARLVELARTAPRIV